MTKPSTKPIYVSLHRLGELSGRTRTTLLLRMRDNELTADAMLDLGGRLHPLFAATRAVDLKRMPSRKSVPAIKPVL